MFIRTLLINSILFGLLSFNCFAQEIDYVTEFNDTGRVIMNEQLRKTSRRISELESGISLTTQVSGILPLANGGTGESLSDPDVDAFLYWDDSESQTDFYPIASLSTPTARFTNAQLFTSSGTWTRPAGVDEAYVIVVGEGGDASGYTNWFSTDCYGAGGGGGGYAEGWITVTGNVTVTINTSYSRFVGSTTIQGNVGGSGGNQTCPTQKSGGSGGTATGGILNVAGANGSGGSSSVGGAGGRSFIGPGGQEGKNGVFWGGGGGGGQNGGGAGTGYAGYVLIYWNE